jgi:hypothetical protein
VRIHMLERCELLTTEASCVDAGAK